MIIKLDAPVADAEEEADGFYCQVPYEMDRKCKQDVLLLVGEWNSIGLYA